MSLHGLMLIYLRWVVGELLHLLLYLSLSRVKFGKPFGLLVEQLFDVLFVYSLSLECRRRLGSAATDNSSHIS